MSQLELTDFESTGVESVPYPVPFPDTVTEGGSRSRHREWYWSQREYDEYACPDCDRGVDDVLRFEVHHIDRNPRNGDPANLLALCQRCHRWRHSDETGLSALSTEEWMREFENINESEFLR